MPAAKSKLVGDYLAQNATFDALHDPPPAAPKPDEAGAVGDAAQAEAVRAYQRLLRVHPDAKTAPQGAGGDRLHQDAAALLDAGVTSAHGIGAMSENAFVQVHRNALGERHSEGAARAIHANARRVMARTSHVHAALNSYRQVQSSGIGDPSIGGPGLQHLPGYEELFGPIGNRPWKQSESIIGPGAYFVDLMRITDEYITNKNAGIPDGLTLEARRPDLFSLPITAENADTEVPYLSVLTEVLESKLGDRPYEVLATSVYPSHLPFELPLEQLRLLLQELGTSPAEIGYTLQDNAQPFDETETQRAGETLGFSKLGLLLTMMPDAPDWLAPRLYGFESGTTTLVNDLSDVPLFLERTGLTRLELDELLRQNLNPSEVAVEAGKFFINSDTVTPPAIAVTPATATAGETIANLTMERLKRISRFIRLWRVLGWTVEEVDWVLRNNATGLNYEAIRLAARMRRIGKALGETSPLAMAALLWNLKTTGHGQGPARESAFDKVFNDAALLGEVDPGDTTAAMLFNLAQPITWMVDSVDGAHGVIRERLIAALKVTDEELTLIADWLVAQGVPGSAKGSRLTFPAPVENFDLPTILTLDLPTLSQLYRTARLASLTKLSVEEFLRLLGLLFYPPEDDPLAPKTVLAFNLDRLALIADAAAWLKQTTFTVSELDWSLTGRSSAAFRAPTPAADLSAFIDSMAAETESLRLTSSELVSESLSADEAERVFRALVGNLITSRGVINEAANKTPDALFKMIAPVCPITEEGLVAAGLSSVDAVSAIGVMAHLNLQNITRGVALSEPNAATIDLDGLFNSEQNFFDRISKRYIVRSELMRAERNTQAVVAALVGEGGASLGGVARRQLNAVVDALAARVGAKPEIVTALLPMLFISPVGPGDLTSLFLTPLEGAEPSDLIGSILNRLAQWSLIATRLNLQPAELALIARNSAAFSILKIYRLTFADIRSLALYKSLATAFNDTDFRLANFLVDPDHAKPTLYEALSQATSWQADEIAYFDQMLLWRSAAWTIARIAVLKRCIDLATRTGVSVAYLLAVAMTMQEKLAVVVTTLPTGAQPAAELDQDGVKRWRALKARVEDAIFYIRKRNKGDAFKKEMGRIDGKLLAAKRDALLAGVLNTFSADASLGIRTRDDLYKYLLLDVEMSAGTSTTRIIQATASVQLYMQRCRLGLESGVNDLSGIAPVWWDWMSTYRVWEANRKIFLFPENYIRPSLRRKATPPFEGLKQTLQQSNLADSAVEDAYRTYLSEVETLGNLRIVDAYDAPRQGTNNSRQHSDLWVFARTTVEPYTYYYRVFEDMAVWTPWMKIEQPIPAQWATPVHAFGAPYLFWSEHRVVDDQKISNGSSQALAATKATIKFIRKRADGTWTPPQAVVSDMVIRYDIDHTLDTAIVKPIVTDGSLKTPDSNWFNLNQTAWQKPAVVFLPTSAIADSATLEKEDRLIVWLGPVFDLAQVRHPTDPETIKLATTSADQAAFETAVNNFHERRSGSSTRTGVMPLFQAYAMDAGASSAPINLTFKANASFAAPVVALKSVEGQPDKRVFGYDVETNSSPVLCSFRYDRSVLPQQPQASATIEVLLENVDPTRVSTLNVKNRLLWSIFDNQDEAFLIRPIDAVLQLSQLDGAAATVGENLSVTNQDANFAPGDLVLTSTEPVELETGGYRFTRLTTSGLPALAQRLSAGGIDALLTIAAQKTPEPAFSRFAPTTKAVAPESGTLDFNGAMGVYLSEIFFHGPFMIAESLKANRRFDLARRWLQYIFDPTAPLQSDLAQWNDRYWNYLPFRGLDQRGLTEMLDDSAQVTAFNNSPFDPDVIAGLRPTAYAKAVVMAYIVNLLEWANELFEQNQRETTNQAINLYAIVLELLGPKPAALGKAATPPALSFNEMQAQHHDAIPEFLVQVEHVISTGVVPMTHIPFNDINPYFSLPENDEFIGYREEAEEMLNNIRQGLTIDGQFAPPPMLSPQLDVEDVMNAAADAAGGGPPTDVAVPAPVSAYRFEALIGRARALAAEVIQLGGAVQNALERQDAEKMEQLRVSNEKELLNLSTDIRNARIAELEAMGEGLKQSQDGAEARRKFYDDLITKGLSDAEKLHLSMIQESRILAGVGGTLKAMAGPAHLIPNVGSPFAMTYGGKQLGASFDSLSALFEMLAGQSSSIGHMAQITAGNERRNQEWEFARDQADWNRKEIAQQIKAAGKLLDGAKRELSVHRKSIQQNAELASFVTGKFTNRELYQWLVSQLSLVMYQTYSLAHGLARSAELALQHELNTDQSFVEFNYWNSVHKGLAAGEGLQLALSRMERAWLDGHARTLEIRKTVALSQIDALALVKFRTTGSCEFALSEALFDRDHPGHYCRKIKSISISIPAAIGPWQSLNATLTQLANQVIVKPDKDAVAFLQTASGTTPSAATLRSYWRPNQQVALSSGLADNGLFVLDFRDDRYLPFEGTGAVSQWRLDMPPAANHFDFAGVADVVIEVSYTALDGGPSFRREVVAMAPVQKYNGQVLLPLADLQPEAWRAFLADPGGVVTEQKLTFTVPARAVPSHVTEAKLKTVTAMLVVADGVTLATSAITLAGDAIGTQKIDIQTNGLGSAPITTDVKMADLVAQPTKLVQQTLTFKISDVAASLMTGGRIDAAKLTNVILVLGYEGKLSW